MKILLINPNTSSMITKQMVDIARGHANPYWEIKGITAPYGSPLITDESSLNGSSKAVLSILKKIDYDIDGVIISAFGDPGLENAKKFTSIPCVGLSESSMLVASQNGRRFSVATTTPKLKSSIEERANLLGVSNYLASIRITTSDPVLIMSDHVQLIEELRIAIMKCIVEDFADAVIIGGGPLASTAKDLKQFFDIPIIEPIPEAVRYLSRIISDTNK